MKLRITSVSIIRILPAWNKHSKISDVNETKKPTFDFSSLTVQVAEHPDHGSGLMGFRTLRNLSLGSQGLYQNRIYTHGIFLIPKDRRVKTVDYLRRAGNGFMQYFERFNLGTNEDGHPVLSRIDSLRAGGIINAYDARVFTVDHYHQGPEAVESLTTVVGPHAHIAQQIGCVIGLLDGQKQEQRQAVNRIA